MTRVSLIRRFGAAGATALFACSSVAAQAASQGSLGGTSQGQITISASVPNSVQITGLSDIAFTNQDPTVAAAGTENVCVWSNTGTKGYNIKATGSGLSNAFTLANSGNTVPYTVEWAATSGQNSGTALTTNVALTGLTTAAINATCSSAPLTTASLIVRISTANLQTMVGSASYTGTLTLLVAPE
jgi:hypothetical protein